MVINTEQLSMKLLGEKLFFIKQLPFPFLQQKVILKKKKVILHYC